MRILIVVAVLAVVAFGRLLVLQAAQRRRTDHAPRRAGTTLPRRITAGAERTWVVFTTPWCATCGPVAARLQAAEPVSRVVTVDATVEWSLARSLGVRAAPTAVLAAADGRVHTQLVGVDAVGAYLDGTT